MSKISAAPHHSDSLILGRSSGGLRGSRPFRPPVWRNQAEKASQSARRVSSWVALVFVILLLSPVGALAADVTFTCNSDIGDGDCALSSSDPIFDVDNMAPGQSVIKSIEVKNESSADDCDFYLSLSGRSIQPDEFDNRLFTALRDNDDNDKYGATDGDEAKDDKKLHDLFDGAGVGKIDTILANTTKEYDWLVTFDEDAGNEFMGAEVSFDAELTGECGEEVSDGPPGGPPGMTLGAITSGPPPGDMINGLLDRFPVAGAESAAAWLQGKGMDWPRVGAALIAAALGIYLVTRLSRLAKARG